MSEETVRLPAARVSRDGHRRVKEYAAGNGISVEELIRRAVVVYVRGEGKGAHVDAPRTDGEWECTYVLMRWMRDKQSRRRLEELVKGLLEA